MEYGNIDLWEWGKVIIADYYCQECVKVKAYTQYTGYEKRMYFIAQNDNAISSAVLWPVLVVGSLRNWPSDLFRPHICVGNRKRIHLCVVWLVKTDMMENIFLFRSNYSRYHPTWRLVLDTVRRSLIPLAIAFSLWCRPPSDAVSSPHWPHT